MSCQHSHEKVNLPLGGKIQLVAHMMGKLLLQMALQSLDFSPIDFSTLRGLEQPGFTAAVPPGALQRSLGTGGKKGSQATIGEHALLM